MKKRYVHGYDSREQERLEVQHRMLGGAAFILPYVSAGQRVLDVGCGTGAIARDVAITARPGSVRGIDISAEQVETAKTLAAGVDNVEFRCGSAQALDFPENSFDLVYGRFVLEHTADPLAVVREMGRVVVPGGWVVACECHVGCCTETKPDIPSAKKGLEALYSLQALEGGDPRIGDRLERLFQDAGLDDVRGEILTAPLQTKEALLQYAHGGAAMLKAREDELLKRGLLCRRDLEAAYVEWEMFPDAPEAEAAFRVRRAAGRKPFRGGKRS